MLGRTAVALILTASSIPAQSADPLAGRWEGEGIALTLTGADEYEVVIEALGAEFPGQAAYDGESLDGSFTSNGEEFFFQARLQPDGAMRLETEQTVYTLTRVSVPAAAPEPTRNPLALAKQQAAAPPGDRFGNFVLNLPEGWSGQVDPQGGVQLTPAGAVSDGSEAYAVTFIPDIEDPASTQALGAAGLLLGQAAQLARVDSSEFESAGRPAALHQLVLDQLQRRLNAYMTASRGGLLTIFASGVSDKVVARDADLRKILDGATFNPQASPARLDPPAPPAGTPGAGQTLSIALAPNAPPFVAGEMSDAQPQSQQWVARLAGKLLTQMESYSSSGGGFNSKDRMVLAADGRFEYAGSSLVSADVGSSAASGGRSSAQGWWRVLTVNNISYLGLAIDGVGQEIYSRLDAQGEETYIDGRRTFVTLPQ